VQSIPAIEYTTAIFITQKELDGYLPAGLLEKKSKYLWSI
jgi:hypothetical protein